MPEETHGGIRRNLYDDYDTPNKNFGRIQKIPRFKGRANDPDNQNIPIYYRAGFGLFCKVFFPTM